MIDTITIRFKVFGIDEDNLNFRIYNPMTNEFLFDEDLRPRDLDALIQLFTRAKLKADNNDRLP